MKVSYIYSACIVVETKDLRICCDPWFEDGIYEGSWFQYPKVANPTSAIGSLDYIFISHIHPDHYDPIWIRKLLDINPSCRLIIGIENQRHLQKKMIRDGFQPEGFSTLRVGGTVLTCVPNNRDYSESIDSALVVRHGKQAVINMNDCPFDSRQVEEVITLCKGAEVAAFLPYAGAGPYPQRYRFSSEHERAMAANSKQGQFLHLFAKYVEAFKPKVAVPFAGLYYLGGSLREFNKSRGIPDALVAAKGKPGVGVVLEEERGQIDLDEFSIVHERTTEFDLSAIETYLDTHASAPFAYEELPKPNPDDLFSDLRKALTAAFNRSTLRIEAWICLSLGDGSFGCAWLNEGRDVIRLNDIDSLSPREEIHIDSRLLKGLMDRTYHWNNAEIGSHFEFNRVGMGYSKSLYDLLSFLHL